MNKPVQHRRKLNTEQIIVLELLYKFRFGSNDLIAQYFGKKDRSFVFRRLSILLEQGLIGKRFESSYRLQAKPAAYYLLPEGARMIRKYRDERDTDEVNIKGIYKDATVSERFVDHCFAILALYIQLMDEYGDALEFLAKGEQLDENMPKQKPDAFLALETDGDMQYYFIDVVDDDAHLLVDVSKKIKRYIEYKNSGDWSLVANTPFPKVIFICNTEESAKRTQKRCDALLSKSWAADIEFEAATKDTVRLG